MTRAKRLRHARGPLDDLMHVADEFWFIRKRPRLLRALQFFIGILAVVFSVGLLACLTAYLGLRFYSADIKDLQGKPLDWSKLSRPDYKKLSSYVYDRNGEIIGRFFTEVRDPVKIDEVPTLLVKGFVAAEDKRFYLHSGVDFLAISRAFLLQTFHRFGFRYGQKSGASGITQQTARLLYADEIDAFRNLEPTYSRKWKEARVAVQLEKRYSKNRILEGFFNSIYFGHGVNGVAEAARFYFGKDIRKDKLTLREIAILVSLDKSPIRYCPIFHAPEKSGSEQSKGSELLQEMSRITLARDRYNWVLGRMLDEGYINNEDYRSSLFGKNDPPELSLLHITPLKNAEFGHGSRMVKELLLVDGFKDGTITSQGGLRIKTSFDASVQKIVSEELERQYLELNREITTTEKIEGAAVVIENRTGKIVALVGGHNFEETQFNRALSLRSPGSVFKPFTYAAAFEKHGKTFDDRICNCPFSLPDKIDIRGRVLKRWVPKNFKEKNPVPSGYIPLPIGLIRSVNLATLDLARRIGIKSVIETANSMGVWGNKNETRDSDGNIWFKRFGANDNPKGLEPYLPTAIGGSGASLLELTSAFSDFARDGTYIQPVIILEIRDSEGRLLYQAPERQEKRVLSEETSRKITILLRAVTKMGTAKIAMRDIRQQVAVKTGTSNGPEDLSMIGYTPEYTIGVRFGYDMPKAIEVPEYMKRVSGGAETQVSGGWVAGLVWRRILDRMYANRNTVDFSPEVESGLQEILGKYGNR
jgi:penicillin-binding protein 1A